MPYILLLEQLPERTRSEVIHVSSRIGVKPDHAPTLELKATAIGYFDYQKTVWPEQTERITDGQVRIEAVFQDVAHDHDVKRGSGNFVWKLLGRAFDDFQALCTGVVYSRAVRFNSDGSESSICKTDQDIAVTASQLTDPD